MLRVAFRPSNTTVAEPRNGLPFAVAGMSQVQVTAPWSTRATCARRRTVPTRAGQVTRPLRRTAPVSERATVIRIESRKAPDFLRAMAKATRSDALILVLTAVATLALDLVYAVIIGLAAFPWLLALFAWSFEARFPRWLLTSGLAVVALSLWTVALPPLPAAGEPRTPAATAFVVAFVMVWSALSLTAAARLWTVGADQPLARARARTMALAAFLLTAALLLAGLAPVGEEISALQVTTVTLSLGAALLFIGGFAQSIVGLGTSDSRDLLRIFQSYVTRPENIVRVTWTPGDLVLFDNRITQHYAPDVLHPDGASRIESFAHDPWPRWTFRLEDGSAACALLSSGEVACRARGGVRNDRRRGRRRASRRRRRTWRRSARASCRTRSCT